MRVSHYWPRWVPRFVVLLLLLASAQAADEADALPSLFDFLGAMVEQDGVWVDPLDMEQILASAEATDAQQPQPETGDIEKTSFEPQGVDHAVP